MPSPSHHERITEWVNLYTQELHSWALYRTSDGDAAEDLVQETFIAALEGMEAFRSDSQPRTWLFSILNHKIADHHRRTSRSAKVPFNEEGAIDGFFASDGHWTKAHAPNDWDEPEPHLLDNEDFRRVMDDCLGVLPAQWNSCITRRFIGSEASDAICQDLGISETNYWQILHRAKLRLRECLEHHWFRQQ